MGIITDAVMETIGINLGVYRYYGVQPFEFLGFPYWWGFINGGSFVTIGAILAFAVPRLQVPQTADSAVAPFGMMVAYFGVGSVHILVHNSALPTWVRLGTAAVMMVMMVGWMFLLHQLVGRKANEAAPSWNLGRMFITRGCCTPSVTSAVVGQDDRRGRPGRANNSPPIPRILTWLSSDRIPPSAALSATASLFTELIRISCGLPTRSRPRQVVGTVSVQAGYRCCSGLPVAFGSRVPGRCGQNSGW